jgi:hypothetical protein
LFPHACLHPQLFLTVGTIVFGAYVAVRVFGVDPSAAGSGGGGNRRGGRPRGGRAARGREARDPGPLGLLGGLVGGDSDADSGLVDVWFERGGGGGGGGGKRGDKARRR